MKGLELACKVAGGMALEKMVMDKAWSLVEPKMDWRAPIDASVSEFALDAVGVEVEVVAAAVAYMTAGEATVTATKEGYRITGKGYRNGPAGP